MLMVNVGKYTIHGLIVWESEGKDIKSPNDTMADSPGNPPEDYNPVEEGLI